MFFIKLSAMSDNARAGISSAALRYLQLIEQNEENGDANVEALSTDVYNKLKGDDDKQDESMSLSFNNPFAENKHNPFKDQFSKNEQKRSEDILLNSYNNPFAESHENKQDDSLLRSFNNLFTDNQQNDVFFNNNENQNSNNNRIKSFNNLLDATDILIDDSDVNFRPQTDQMSFRYSQDNNNSILIPTSSVKSLEFGSSSSKSIPSPPVKRFCYDPKDTFFNKTNEQSGTLDSFFKQQAGQSGTSESFFRPAKKNNNCTEDIFDVQNFNSSYRSMYTINEDSVANSVFNQPSMCSDLNETAQNSESDMDSTMKNDLLIKELSEDQMDQDLSRENATTSTRKRSSKVNTFYQAPQILNTQKIDEFYKTHNATDWKSDDINLDNLMEPSLDYILHRLNCLRPLTTGRENDIISYDDEDAYNCNSITEGINEIEDSFDKGKFICSTPEEPVSSDDEQSMEIGDLNMPNNAVTSTNVPKEDDNDDNDKTKSFLVNKETVWSAVTHVSCSIPLEQQENSEPQFDITTIFDFSNQNELQDSELRCLDNDTARYELMLSILKDCNNPFNQTTAEEQETLKIAENRKAAIMSQIEMLIEALVTSLVNQDTMIIRFHRIKDWKDCKYESNVLSQKETAIKIKSLSFTNKNTERTFTIVVHLLGEIYKLLGQNITCTKRELYYRDVELMSSQVSVNKAIDEICALFNVQCWELGVLSTSKGLVAGDLRIVTDEDEIIDYSTTNSVPQKPSGIKSMESNAEYVLVVEKDTVFTRLIEDNVMEKIGKKIILVTAKGYPDINTRVLLKKFEMELQKPIYIIVDADAFGIDIMCTYKFGSLQMVKFSEQLAIPTMEWIGIHPTDIEKLDITRIPLTDADVKKVDELLARPYINDHLRIELEHLKNRGLKAEIESIYHFSIGYLVHDYIPQKIAAIPGPIKDIVRGSSCFKEHLFP